MPIVKVDIQHQQIHQNIIMGVIILRLEVMGTKAVVQILNQRRLRRHHRKGILLAKVMKLMDILPLVLIMEIILRQQLQETIKRVQAHQVVLQLNHTMEQIKRAMQIVIMIMAMALGIAAIKIHMMVMVVTTSLVKITEKVMVHRPKMVLHMIITETVLKTAQ